MKIQGSIVINQPVKKVAELFADPKNLKEYQEGFLSKELVSGIEGQDGAVSKIMQQFGKRKMELIETITANRLPDSFEANIHHKHMDNTMKCTFTAISDNQTQFAYEFEYTRISWIMPRLIAILFPSLYRKQIETWMTNFKTFAEKQ